MGDVRKGAAARRTIRFRVPVPGMFGTAGDWLRADGTLGPVSDAAVFAFWASPTVAERARIAMRCHDIAGGLSAWIDLERAIDRVRAGRRKRIEAEVWPNGRPAADDADARRAQEAAFIEAWNADESEEREMFSALTGQRDLIEFLASWQELAESRERDLGESVPAGWANLADRENLPDHVFNALWSAWNDAHTETNAGK